MVDTRLSDALCATSPSALGNGRYVGNGTV